MDSACELTELIFPIDLQGSRANYNAGVTAAAYNVDCEDCDCLQSIMCYDKFSRNIQAIFSGYPNATSSFLSIRLN